jgi:hypothetical protein
MTILFLDGFENYNANADMAGMWTVGNVNTFLQAGRDASGNSIRLNLSTDTITHSIGNHVSGVMGFGFRYNTNPIITDWFAELRETAAGEHLRLYLTSSGNLEVRRVATSLSLVSARTLAEDVWNFIEWRWLINDTTGETEVRVNGKSGGWINASGLDTQNGGNAFVDAVRLKGSENFSGRPYDYDDFYVLDLTGGAPGNTFLGDCLVETLNPSGAGAEAQWSPSAGVPFQNVDEATPDGDTTFNSSGVVGDDDRHAMDNLVNVPSTVFAVQVQAAFRNENSGARDVRLKAFDSVTEGQSGDKTPTFDPAYVFEFEVFEDHPTDANPWSTAEVNAMEAGYRVQA